MNIKIKSKEENKTSQWSGGETTELLIYPSNSSYVSRDFDFRISSATVRLKESVFTRLPGFSRKLMVLDGQVKLCHENHHEMTLGKYDVDAFEGHWQTTSFGTCTDFNVMTSPQYRSELWAEHFNAGESKSIEINSDTKWFFVFVAEGSILFFSESVNQSQLIIIEDPESYIQVAANHNAVLVLVEIY